MANWLVRHQRFVNISGISAATIAVTRTVLLGWPEPYPWMSEAGELLYDLGLGWASAWAFQLLVVVLPAERERQRFNILIAPRVDGLIEIGREFAQAVSTQAGKTPAAHLEVDAEALKQLCKTVGLRAEVPGWAGDWGSILRHWGSRAASVRAALRPFYARLTPELLGALWEEELAMDEVMRMERFARAFDAPDMSRLEGSLFRWLTSTHMLVEERRKALAPEIPMPEPSSLDGALIKVPIDDYIRQREEFVRSLEPETD